MTITVTRACGHRERVTIAGGTAATKSAMIFHAQMENCDLCQHEADTADTADTAEMRDMKNQNTAKATAKRPAIRPDATIQIQQDCDACHGTGEASDGAICVTCWGTRRVTCSITLRELSRELNEALMEMLPETARLALGVRVM